MERNYLHPRDQTALEQFMSQKEGSRSYLSREVRFVSQSLCNQAKDLRRQLALSILLIQKPADILFCAFRGFCVGVTFIMTGHSALQSYEIIAYCVAGNL